MRTFSYVTNNQVMNMEAYLPENWKESDKRTCLIFYFGGGFVKRKMTQFKRQSEYFASLGCVCLNVDYRLASETKELLSCQEDAVASITHIKEHASELGIDARKMVVCGGSAGGAMACWASQLTQIPCAQVLFNPSLYHGPLNIEKVQHHEMSVLVNDEKISLKDDSFPRCLGRTYKQKPKLFSCYHLLDEYSIPKTLIFQGTYDPLTYQDVILFQQKAEEKGFSCHSVLYEMENHGFFNYDKIEDKFCYFDTLNKTETFLKDLGLL